MCREVKVKCIKDCSVAW